MIGAVVAGVVLTGLWPRGRSSASGLITAMVALLVLAVLRPPVVLLIGAADVVAMAMLFVTARRERARRAEGALLPELSDTLAISIGGGTSFVEAIASARHLAGARLGPLMDASAAAIGLGVPMTAAMSEVGEMAGDTDHETRLVLAAIEVGAAHPSQRGRALTDAAESLRLRRLRREDLTAQAAQARASAVVVTWSPWLVVMLAAIVDRSHLARLTSTTLGQWCVVGAGTLSLAGAATMRAMIARSGLT